MGVDKLIQCPPHQYKLEKRDLQGRTLNLSVWHHDSLGRNLFLGEVEIALGTWDWANTSPEWFNLQPRVSPMVPQPTPTTHSPPDPPSSPDAHLLRRPHQPGQPQLGIEVHPCRLGR